MRRVRRVRRRFSAVGAAILLTVFGSGASAQVGSGEITGVIRDSAGAAVPGTTITITAVTTNQKRVVTSTGDGIYTVPGLAPGGYTIDVTLQGFGSIHRDGVQIATGQ